MFRKPLFVAFGLAILIVNSFARESKIDVLSSRSVSEDNSLASSAIRELRSMGQVGLDALLDKYAPEITRYAETGLADAGWKRIAAAIDTVAMQKDAYASGLYWHTDMDEAKRISKAKRKPILSLRLLGNLNEEFSCANSRLFRALLYANAEISKYLREHYVLHWQSVRPAPRITIDFGDGRKIERTITGNSIHYIIDVDGLVIDALPGLYSPSAFLMYVKEASQVSRTLRRLSQDQHATALMKYRKWSFDQIVTRRDKAVKIADVKLTAPPTGTLAIMAAPVAVTKMAVVDEMSLLRVYDDFARFEPAIDLSEWNKLARLYSTRNSPDEKAVAFIRRQNARTGLSEAEFASLLMRLENFIALDTTRNDFLYHTRLYQWLNQDPTTAVDRLNTRVYAEIFQTPENDEWLGLYSTDVYTALDGNGVIK